MWSVRSTRAESQLAVFATLIRLLGDFELAEEALHDAFASAVEQWPTRRRAGEPPSVARLGRAVQSDRRDPPPRAVRCLARRHLPGNWTRTLPREARDDEGVEDDRLRLIFTCCHPRCRPRRRWRLTLREVCGLTTEEIARGVPDPVADHRRSGSCAAKAKIRDAEDSVPGAVGGAICPSGSTPCCACIYLVFNEGYSASSGRSR